MKEKLSRRNIIVIGLVVILLIILVVGYILLTNKSNNSYSIYDKIIVDNLVFDNAILEEDNGLYNYRVEITNKNKKDYKMNYFIFEFYDKDDNLITSTIGYVKDVLKTNEKVTLNSAIDTDIKAAKKIKIEIK